MIDPFGYSCSFKSGISVFLPGTALLEQQVALERAGINERIDHRTLEAQGLERIPQIHLGARVAAMEKRGISTAVGDEHRRIEQVNAQLAIFQIKLDINRHQIKDEKELEKPRIRKQRESLRQQKIEQRKRKRAEQKRQKEEQRKLRQSRKKQELEQRRKIEAEAKKLIEQVRKEELKRTTERQAEEQRRLEARKKALAEAKARRNQEISQLIKTINKALDKHGQTIGQIPNKQIIFQTRKYQIISSKLLDEYSLEIGRTIVAKNQDERETELKYNRYNSGEIQLIYEQLSLRDIEHFRHLENRLEKGEKVQEFYELTNDFFTKLAQLQKVEIIDKQFIAKGEKYTLISDSEGFRIISKDGREEILNYPQGVRNPELIATSKFDEFDVDNFKEANKQADKILDKIRRRERQREQERRAQKRGRGFHL